MQEMRISQLVLDPTSNVDSKNLKARSSPGVGNLKARSSPCLAVNTPLPTAIKSPTPVAEKKLVASRRSTRRQEAQGKDGDTNVHSRVAAISYLVGPQSETSKPACLQPQDKSEGVGNQETGATHRHQNPS